MLVCSALPLLAPLPHLEDDRVDDVVDVVDVDVVDVVDPQDINEKTYFPCQGSLGFSDGGSPAAFSEMQKINN